MSVFPHTFECDSFFIYPGFGLPAGRCEMKSILLGVRSLAQPSILSFRILSMDVDLSGSLSASEDLSIGYIVPQDAR